ncbi:MAG TPA: GDP-L-fucose synthase [Longimicrobiales bacterium]
MNHESRIYVAGHRGLVGSALVRTLEAGGYRNLLLRTHAELDLTNAAAVDEFFRAHRPEYVFVAAAKVGGILANHTYPADFIRDNLAIALNVIDAAHRYHAAKLLFLSSSCVYPKLAPQPMKEDYLLTGALEPTNEPYAIAKIAGMKLCESYHRQHGAQFFSVLPTNLYGPNDNFDLETSHVVPALIRKFHEAAQSGADHVVLWGTGRPRRELMHVDDAAAACVFLMQHYDAAAPINIGVGEDLAIAELAALIARIAGFTGSITYDSTKPDGTPRKLLDVSRLHALGWSARIDLREGIQQTCDWYRTTRAARPGPTMPV